MRRNERIHRYLESHLRVNERMLQKKFGLSWREAHNLLTEKRGELVKPKKSLGINFHVPGWKKLWLLLIQNEHLFLLFLVVLAVLVRSLYLWKFLRDPVLQLPLLDAQYYLEWAKRIVDHGWLGDKVFFTEPFYAYLLAVLIKLFNFTNGPWVLRGLQFLLGSLFPILLYFVGKRFLSRSIGMVAGLLAALYGPLVFYDSLLLKTSLEVYTLPVFLLLIWSAFEHPRIKSFFWSGLCLGFIALVKGNVIILAPMTLWLLFSFFRTEPLRWRMILAGVFLAGILTCLMPVMLRNYVVGHDIVPTNYSVGLVVYQGNWWGGDGSTARVPTFLRPHPRYEETDAVKMAESYVGHELPPSAVSRFWIRKAISEVIAAPGHFFLTLGHKVLLLLNYREYSDNYSFDFYRSHLPLLWILPNSLFLIVLGGVGLGMSFLDSFERFLIRNASVPGNVARNHFRRSRLMLLSFFLSYAAVLLATTINARYRMPLMPFFMVFAACLIVFVQDCLRERLLSVFKTLLVMVALLTVIVVWPLSLLRRVTYADAYNNIANWYQETGAHDQAKSYFEKTVAADDAYEWGYLGLTRVALEEGRFSDAENLLKKLIMIRPDDLTNYNELQLLRHVQTLTPEEARKQITSWFEEQDQRALYDSDFYEGQRLLAANDNMGAEAAFQRSLEKQGSQVETLIALASLKSRTEDRLSAKHYLQIALTDNPYLFTARYNLANVFIRENNYSQVADLLKTIYDFTPELADTWYNYAVALIKQKKNAEATLVIQAYIDRYKDDTDSTRVDRVKKFQDALKPSNSSLDQMVKNGLPQSK